MILVFTILTIIVYTSSNTILKKIVHMSSNETKPIDPPETFCVPSDGKTEKIHATGFHQIYGNCDGMYISADGKRVWQATCRKEGKCPDGFKQDPIEAAKDWRLAFVDLHDTDSFAATSESKRYFTQHWQDLKHGFVYACLLTRSVLDVGHYGHREYVCNSEILCSFIDDRTPTQLFGCKLDVNVSGCQRLTKNSTCYQQVSITIGRPYFSHYDCPDNPVQFQAEMPCVVCNTDCVQSEWIAQPCQISTKDGNVVCERNLTRTIEVESAGRGTECGNTTKHEICDINNLSISSPCITECKFSSWSPWTECDTKNADSISKLGSRNRIRSTIREAFVPEDPKYNALRCRGSDLFHSEYCYVRRSAGCQWSEWADMSQCKRQDNGPQFNCNKTRVRFPLVESIRDLLDGCKSQIESVRCTPPDDLATCDLDCIQSEWVPDPCSAVENDDKVVECKRRMHRVVTVNRTGGGLKCGAVMKVETCNIDDEIALSCISGCQVTSWTGWTNCSTTDPLSDEKHSVRNRTRDIIRKAMVPDDSRFDRLLCNSFDLIEQEICEADGPIKAKWDGWKIATICGLVGLVFIALFQLLWCFSWWMKKTRTPLPSANANDKRNETQVALCAISGKDDTSTF